MDNDQAQKDQAAVVAATAFNNMPGGCLKIFGWLVVFAFWVSLAAAFPKTISVLTVLLCVGYVCGEKNKHSLESVKWGRVIVFTVLSVVFFASSFSLKESDLKKDNRLIADFDYSLAERFNIKAAERKLPYRAGVKKRHETVSEFSVSDTESAGFLGTKKGNAIDAVFFIGCGDGRLQSGADQLIVLSLLIETIDESLSDSARSKMIFKMVDSFNKPGCYFKQTSEFFSYSSVYRENTGWWVTID